MCTGPLPGGRQGTGSLHLACRPLQREAGPAPGSPEFREGHVGTHVRPPGDRAQWWACPCPGVPGEVGAKQGPPPVIGAEGVQGDEGQPGIREVGSAAHGARSGERGSAAGIGCGGG